MKKAIFAGGCFWCTEAVFKRVEGVVSVTPGYIGGTIKNPCYREVCIGITGHAEAVEITYDPVTVSYDLLLEIFFATHDPTTFNRQGNDIGTQYRSGIFYLDNDQKADAEAYISWLNREEIFDRPIITEVTPAGIFYEAEDYHHDYYDGNKSQPYCQVIIHPKLRKLQKLYSNKLKVNQ